MPLQAIPMVNHIDKLKEWLATYPPLGNFGFNTDNMQGEIHIIEYDPWAAVGANMLQNVNAIFNARYDDIIGTVIMDAEVSYMLFARRNVNDNFWRKEASEFLTHLCQWCEQEYVLGRQPTFGNVDMETERIKITGGSPWNTVEGQPGVMDFMWQFNLKYKLQYEED
jgi:hypothetical protein